MLRTRRHATWTWPFLCLAVGFAGRAGAATPQTALSLFVPAEGRCRWVRVDTATRQERIVASFSGDCTGARVAWSGRGDQALVWFDPSLAALRVTPSGIERRPAQTAREHLYRVRLGAGRPERLPLPPSGRLAELAFDAQGEPLALTIAATKTLVVDGKKLEPPAGEGEPALAHAFRLDGGRWSRVETRASRQGADLSPGIAVLERAGKLGPRSHQLLPLRPPGQQVTDAALLGQLRAFAPKLVPGDDGRWLALTAGAGTVLVWQAAVEQVFSTGSIAWLDGGKLAAPPGLGLGAEDVVGLATEGPHLLVATFEDGGRPRVYHLEQRALVYASDAGRGASFWPAAAPP